MILLNGKKPARKSTFKIGTGVVSHRLTTDGTVGTASIGIENSSEGHLVPVMWISETPGGKPIKVMYGAKGKRHNAAKAKGAGQEIPLTTGRKTRQAQVKLELGKTYYLCHELKARRGGVGPTESSMFLRSCSIGGGR